MWSVRVMQCRRSILCGVVVLAVVSLLATITYILSQAYWSAESKKMYERMQQALYLASLRAVQQNPNMPVDSLLHNIPGPFQTLTDVWTPAMDEAIRNLGRGVGLEQQADAVAMDVVEGSVTSSDGASSTSGGRADSGILRVAPSGEDLNRDTSIQASEHCIAPNHGPCREGTFPCGNSTVCVPQRLMCNGFKDCPDGEDENRIKCMDLPASSVNDLMNKRVKGPGGYECTLTGVPKDCNCTNLTFLLCQKLGLVEIPQDVSTNVSRMVLTDNNIKLRASSFQKYNLELIHLQGNNITDIPPGTFKGQTSLTKLLLLGNRLRVIQPGVLKDLPKLDWLILENNTIEDIALEDFTSLNLTWLDLSYNRLTLKDKSFPWLPRLLLLFLEGNYIEEIRENTFARLYALETLILQKNKIRTVHERAFWNLTNLKDLDLSFNQLMTLPATVFNPLSQLTKLSLGNNPLEVVPSHLFSKLSNLSSLNLEEIEIENIDVDMFSFLKNLSFVYFKKFYYCTYAPRVRNCRPNSDGVSSLNQLLVKPILRVTVWVVATLTCVGNILVLWGRFFSNDENRVLSLVIRNLAVADLLMGVYLFVIAIQDFTYRDMYQKAARSWMTSWTCTVIGMVAMVSSEVSVLILVFMSVERFLLIAVPFGGHRNMTMTSASLYLSLIWTAGISLASIPAIYWWDSRGFYGTNGMCFPLHIDDPFLMGWQYSAFVFLGINLPGLCIIAILYTWMFVSIYKTRHATPISAIGDFEFIIRFFFIVLTDAACWAPIIALKFLALSRIPISADLYAWVVVFILPVNSALNPLLYTFTTPKYRGQFLQLGWPRSSSRRLMSRRQSTPDTEYSRSSTNRNVIICTRGTKNLHDSDVSVMMPVLRAAEICADVKRQSTLFT